jgi:hypothetical protein
MCCTSAAALASGAGRPPRRITSGSTAVGAVLQLRAGGPARRRARPALDAARQPSGSRGEWSSNQCCTGISAEANRERRRTAQLRNREQRGPQHRLGREPVVSCSSTGSGTRRNPAKRREFPRLTRASALRTPETQTTWRWGQSRANSSLPAEQGRYREIIQVRGYWPASRIRERPVAGHLRRDFPGSWNRERRPGKRGILRPGSIHGQPRASGVTGHRPGAVAGGRARRWLGPRGGGRERQIFGASRSREGSPPAPSRPFGSSPARGEGISPAVRPIPRGTRASPRKINSDEY